MKQFTEKQPSVSPDIENNDVVLQIENNETLAKTYFPELKGERTARHASEVSYSGLNEAVVKEGTARIRKDIGGAFANQPDNLELPPEPLQPLKQRYWVRAKRVGVEHGAKPGFELDDYLAVGPGRSYESIKSAIEKDYDEHSIPRNALEAIDVYHEVLDINPVYAATITMQLIGKGLPVIGRNAQDIAKYNDMSRPEATKIAFADFITSEVPQHLNSIITKYGYGDAAIKSHFNKGSFYPKGEDIEEGAALEMSPYDVEGLIRVYDIQSRPYSDEELTMADDLAEIPDMQAAMIHVHEALVSASEGYLKAHPERASGDLRNFSEIFVREKATGELLPNPKLLRAIVNNILPGVAKDLLARGMRAYDVDEEAIVQGVHIAAKDYQLFSAHIGQFNSGRDNQSDIKNLNAVYKVVCPANVLFPKFVAEYLPAYLNRERKAKL